jgi:hypothetical protein
MGAASAEVGKAVWPTVVVEIDSEGMGPLAIEAFNTPGAVTIVELTVLVLLIILK